MIGTKTNIICGCEITPGNFSDIRQSPSILLKTGANFNVKEVSADKAYSSKLVFRIIQSIGALPYIVFKNNSKEPDENSPDIWNQMFLIFRDKKERFMESSSTRPITSLTNLGPSRS